MADITLRQLIIAKAVDNLHLRLGSQSYFPFIIQPTITANTSIVDVPTDIIWDMQVSLPAKWQNLRLARIKRISGNNDDYTGILRFIFSANVEDSTTETYIFYVDYTIDDVLGFQVLPIQIVTTDEESSAISSGERQSVSGFVTFKTLPTNRDDVIVFLDLLAPPTDTADENQDGLYDNPAVYDITDSEGGGTAVTDDISLSSINHGTGMLTLSAWNSIPKLDSDIQGWIETFNYPFDSDANRRSTDNITIPNGLFREFDIVAPAGDQPSGDTSGLTYPVWIRRIERIGTGSSQLRFYFATYDVTDEEVGGTPSTNPVEFAYLDLLFAAQPGDVVEITPIDNLQGQTETDTDWGQHFGRGHVVLSDLWNKADGTIEDFYNAFESIISSPPDTNYPQSSTRISSFGVSRVPKYTPTIGQARAMLGSTSKRVTPIHPSLDNTFVTEQDQGLGDRVDLEQVSGITPNDAFGRFGYAGGLCHKLVKLEVDGSLVPDNDTAFYNTHTLPRLRALLGRDPVFGDRWFQGVRFLDYNGDTWIG